MVSVLQYCVLFVFCYASCKMLSVLKEDPQQKQIDLAKKKIMILKKTQRNRWMNDGLAQW